jgi:hypothetical protein
MKISLIALIAGCAVAGSALAHGTPPQVSFDVPRAPHTLADMPPAQPPHAFADMPPAQPPHALADMPPAQPPHALADMPPAQPPHLQ